MGVQERHPAKTVLDHAHLQRQRQGMHRGLGSAQRGALALAHLARVRLPKMSRASLRLRREVRRTAPVQDRLGMQEVVEAAMIAKLGHQAYRRRHHTDSAAGHDVGVLQEIKERRLVTEIVNVLRSQLDAEEHLDSHVNRLSGDAAGINPCASSREIVRREQLERAEGQDLDAFLLHRSFGQVRRRERVSGENAGGEPGRVR
mmetsp:Transcript_171/g.735  ORF Transcript_171/g.735 Transcript_171/m.735 type:complete len:202 (-) Transcript_171:1153-1758(-)